MNPTHGRSLAKSEGFNEKQRPVLVADLVTLVELLVRQHGEVAVGTIGTSLLLVVDHAQVAVLDDEAGLILHFPDGGLADSLAVLDGSAGQNPERARPFGVFDQDDPTIHRQDSDFDGAVLGMVASTVTFLAHGALLGFRGHSAPPFTIIHQSVIKVK